MTAQRLKLPTSLYKLGRFTFKQAKEAGLPQSAVVRLTNTGVIEKISRGIYESSERQLDPATRDFAVACITLGEESVIGGLTALFNYGLAEEVPAKLWVLVPPTTYRTARQYRLVRTKIDLRVGVERHADYRITSLERTIVDTFIFSSKLGEKLAYRAALRAIREKRTTPDKLFKMAHKLGVTERLAVHAQALFGGLEA
jgi:predicted transcriptional regulator of viral defense system